MEEKKTMKAHLIERIIRNSVTSLIGLIMIVFCLVMLWAQKAAPESLYGWFIYGMHLIGVKNSAIGLKNPE